MGQPQAEEAIRRGRYLGSISVIRVFFTLTYFTNNEEPYGGVVVSSNVVYGFGRYGGTSSNGVVYSAAGGGYSVLLNFDGVTGSGSYSAPVLSGNTLFGVTYSGGTNGGGNIFSIDTDGSHYTNLFSLQAGGGANTTGSNPCEYSGLVLSRAISCMVPRP